MSNTETIAEVLYRHPTWSEGFYAGRSGWAVWCSGCDAPLTDADALAAHQAEMVSAALEPVIRERERVAWDRGYDGACADFQRDDGTDTANHYDTKEEA